MSLSRRYTIHWPHSQSFESEEASTVVVTSPSGLFVDIRVLQPSTTATTAFDWFFAGHEIEHDQTTIEFIHDFYDSKFIEHDVSQSEVKFKIETDIGHFSDPENPTEKEHGIRVETGEMINPSTGLLEPYIEKWITCNPLNGPELEYIGDNDTIVKCVVLQTCGADKIENVKQGEYIGRIIKFGDWTQGVVWRKGAGKKLEDCVGVIRSYKDDVLINYGSLVENFPDTNVNGMGEIVDVKSVKWKVVEYSG